MKRTNTANKEILLKEKIRSFFSQVFKSPETDLCPIKDLLATSLDKWSLFCIYNLGYYQILRFNELKHKIDGISSRMLSATLKKLEKNNIVSRKVYAEVPPRVEYELTEFGRDFTDKVMDMSKWYMEHYKG